MAGGRGELGHRQRAVGEQLEQPAADERLVADDLARVAAHDAAPTSRPSIIARTCASV